MALYAGAPVFVPPEMLELPTVVHAPDALPALEIHNERARIEKGPRLAPRSVMPTLVAVRLAPTKTATSSLLESAWCRGVRSG